MKTIKQLATLTIIIGTAFNHYGIYPLGPLILTLGTILWAWGAILMRDRELIITNIGVLIIGLLALIGGNL
jgi:hypothetical protein